MQDEPSSSDLSGLALLVDRLWGQEVTHKIVLAELLRHTDLAARLGLWAGQDRPGVAVEPDDRIFDLALASGVRTAVFIELKFGAQSGQNQRERQQRWAEAAKADRVYILLGTSFFEIPHETGVRYVGVPQLLEAVASVEADGAVGELARAYAGRLGRDAVAWTGDHDDDPGGVATLRLYTDIAAAWPVDVQPYRVTNPGGPDWILNADAWTSVDTPGWASARFYWEIAGRHVRFKIEWTGNESARATARDAYLRALEAGAKATGFDVRPTARRLGRGMTAAQFPELVRDLVVVGGRVNPERARALYDDATAVFRAALRNLEPLVATERPA